jgi:hypothetical protein
MLHLTISAVHFGLECAFLHGRTGVDDPCHSCDSVPEFSSHRVRWLVFAAEKVLFDVTTKKTKPTTAIRLTTGRPKTRTALRAAPNLKI